MIVYELVTPQNCSACALDGYQRHQVVTECWRKIDGTYKLVSCPFVDDWTPQRKQEKVQ